MDQIFPGFLSNAVTHGCIEALAPWRNPDLLSRRVPLGSVASRVVVTTDASTRSWGAVCEGMPASGLWSEPQSRWHINRLEWEAIFLALKEFRTQLEQQHVLIRTNNTSNFVYKSPGRHSLQGSVQAGNESPAMGGLSPLSIRAAHIPGLRNRGADMLLRKGRAEVDLFATSENAHSPLFFSPSHSPLEGDALASRCPAARLYAFPPIKILPWVLYKIREERVSVIFIAQKRTGRTSLGPQT